MRIPITFMSLIRNKHWLRLQMCTMLLILAAQPNYSSALSQTFPGSTPYIETAYDKDKDETRVGALTMLEERTVEVGVGFPPMATMPVKESIFLVVAYYHKGRQLNSPPAVVTMVVESQARQFRFGEGTELLSVIDGKRLALGQMRYSSSDPLIGLLPLAVQVERLRIEVPLKTFLRLARARTAALIIGSKELRLGEQNFNVLSAIANCMIGKTVPPPPSSGAEKSKPAPLGKCPIQTPKLLALRGFKLGMSIQEVRNLFPGGAPPISELSKHGRRSMKADFSAPPDSYGATRLSQLKFEFIDERVAHIEAWYNVGKEWKDRTRDFAYFISNELGVSVTWDETPSSRLFRVDCDAVSISLYINDDRLPFSGSRQSWTATATLELDDEKAGSLYLQRLRKNSK